MKTTKLNKKNFLNDISLLFGAMILTNSWNGMALKQQFSLLGILILITGTLFVLLLRYISNLEEK